MPEGSTRVALVTGSGRRRVGWHVAQALAGRGYAIALHYRSSGDEAAETVGHLLGAERTAGAADILDDHLLAEILGHRFRDEARHRVGRSAGSEGHDDCNGALRIGLGGCGVRQREGSAGKGDRC